jgi:hypothetical protein
MTLFGCAEHQRLIDGAQVLYLGLSLLESRLQLLCSHLKILDVGGGCEREKCFIRGTQLLYVACSTNLDQAAKLC